MFLTHANQALPAPAGLFGNGAARWRSIVLPLRAAWFVASIDFNEDGERGVLTHFLSSDQDVCSLIGLLGPAKLLNLVCMLPCSRTGSWRSKDVRKVWMGTSGGGAQVSVFVDANGEEFCADLLQSEPDEVQNRQEQWAGPSALGDVADDLDRGFRRCSHSGVATGKERAGSGVCSG